MIRDPWDTVIPPAKNLPSLKDFIASKASVVLFGFTYFVEYIIVSSFIPQLLTDYLVLLSIPFEEWLA